MFLFCFIPSNKHGCLMYRSFMSLWITFVPPTASSIMSKLPELFYLSLFVNDFKHAFTYRGMYDLIKKKITWSKSPRRNNLGQVAQSRAQVSFFNRNIPGWRFYNLRGQLIPIFDCHHSEFFFPCIQFRFPMSWLMPFVTHVLLQYTFEKSLALSSLALCSWRQQ